MATTFIEIDGLRLTAYHGVYERERRVGNEFEVSLRLFYDAARAMASDNEAAALNYAGVIEVLQETMAVPCALLEHAASNIRNALQRRFQIIRAGRVTVSKLHPPVNAVLNRVSFTVEW